MATDAQLADLVQWLRDHGGSLHPSVGVKCNPSSGVHFAAQAEIGPETCLCVVPHSLALSSLNAKVDDDFPVFKQNQRRLAPEAVGCFYLMYQYINRPKSFWKAYIDTLPQPEDEFHTPFWFDEDDLAWLHDTDVFHTTLARKQNQKDQYRIGLDLLQSAGVDTGPFTWDLFRWAVTMYTSRSFSSRVIHPQDSKYWTAYKTASDGRRQTVLLDLSRLPAEDLDFPVLFPVADAANHKHDARAEWTFDPGRFSISIKDPVVTGAEVFNNYGPKGNAELLLGYGFCITNNPYDGVLLTLKPPPDDLQTELRKVHPGYFTPDARWSGEKATFNLGQVIFDAAAPFGVFGKIPEPLLELMLYILRHERGLTFTFVERPLEYLTADSGNGRRYLPHIARMIVQSLTPKLSKLQSSTPDGEPTNARQEQAKIYRDGQIFIMESLMGALRGFTRSLLPPLPLEKVQGPYLCTFDNLLSLWMVRGKREEALNFVRGVCVATGSANCSELVDAGWEDDLLVLLLCYLYLYSLGTEGGIDWIQAMLPEYLASGDFRDGPSQRDPQTSADSEVEEHVSTLLRVVQAAAQACPQSTWESPVWNVPFIVDFGGEFIKYDSFPMMVPFWRTKSLRFEDEAHPVVYIHQE